MEQKKRPAERSRSIAAWHPVTLSSRSISSPLNKMGWFDKMLREPRMTNAAGVRPSPLSAE
jgi:hypothetical protein